MGTLSLTDPVNGQPNDATTIANNNAAIKTVVNGQIDATNLADPGTGKFYGSSGGGAASAIYPPGHEIDRVTFTTGVSVTMTTESTSANVVSSNTNTFDGSLCCIEFFSPAVTPPSGASSIVFVLNNGSNIGRLASVANAVSTQIQTSVYAKVFLSPAAGTATYSVKAFVSSGTGVVGAGAGGSGVSYPGFIRITKV